MKLIDFFIGIAVLFMGLLPFLARIEAVASRISLIGKPGEVVYQVILIVLGVLAIAYSLKQEKK